MTTLRGKCSWFGGPEDTGVAPDEGLAFIYSVDMAPYLFLPEQPPGTTGLARRLNPDIHYIACRWDYDMTSKEDLLEMVVDVRAPSTGRVLQAFPADWGPHESTGRVADLSHGLMTDLGITTDDEVEVTFEPPGEEWMDKVYSKIAISSGHGLKVRGAAGPEPWGLDEVDEVRLIVDALVPELRLRGVEAVAFHDNKSTSQSANLSAITSWHNKQDRELDISVHLNAYQATTTKPMGTEVLYVTQEDLARRLSAAIASTLGLPDRGPKYRSDLAFLNNTNKPAVLLEVVFCDAKVDCDALRAKFDLVISALADVLGGPLEEEVTPPEPEPVPPAEAPLVEIAIAAPEGVRLRIILDGSVVLDESRT